VGYTQWVYQVSVLGILTETADRCDGDTVFFEVQTELINILYTKFELPNYTVI
jgi:hypothetical protein